MPDDTLQLVFFAALILGLAPPMGIYMFLVYTGQPTLLSPVLVPAEQLIYRLAGVNRKAGQHWTRYAFAVIALNFAGFLVFYAILRLQHLLPLNPRGFGPLDAALAFNTAISFVTNTNWQSYSGETTLSYFSQMAGCTVQNFLSAATGMAVAVAVIRGFSGRQIKTIGNFHVDLTRSVLYILLPIAIITAPILVFEGVPQNLGDYVIAKTVEGQDQLIAQGPVASQTVIKNFGTNGGGFFNTNSAHPYENPTPISNYIQLLLILLIPAGFTITFGKMVGDIRQGWALFSAMAVLYVGAVVFSVLAESMDNPLLTQQPVDQLVGNMEGKEARFGVAASALWAVTTTVTSTGSVNAMLDSFTPLGGTVSLLNIQLGEVIFGGVGSGIYGVLFYVLLAVFIAGLMVGRTPEYLGKKVEAREIKLTMFALLVVPIGMLIVPAIAVVVPSAAASAQNRGPHGLAEILYAYASATGNNGSAFAGFNGATPFHLTAQGLAMLAGRFAFIVPILAIAGSLGAKKTVPTSPGTLPTHTPLFVCLLMAVILVLGGLTFFPALALSTLAEHFELMSGRAF